MSFAAAKAGKKDVQSLCAAWHTPDKMTYAAALAWKYRAHGVVLEAGDTKVHDWLELSCSEWPAVSAGIKVTPRREWERVNAGSGGESIFCDYPARFAQEDFEVDRAFFLVFTMRETMGEYQPRYRFLGPGEPADSVWMKMAMNVAVLETTEPTKSWLAAEALALKSHGVHEDSVQDLPLHYWATAWLEKQWGSGRGMAKPSDGVPWASREEYVGSMKYQFISNMCAESQRGTYSKYPGCDILETDAGTDKMLEREGLFFNGMDLWAKGDKKTPARRVAGPPHEIS